MRTHVATVCFVLLAASSCRAQGLRLLDQTIGSPAASAGTSSDAAPDATRATPVIILVDGIKGMVAGAFSDRVREGNYLRSSALGLRMQQVIERHLAPGQRLEDHLQSLVWEGTYLIHPENKLSAIDQVRMMIDEARQRSDCVTVIGHSQGAEISYIALQQLARGVAMPTSTHFFTLGSYLRFTSMWHPQRQLSRDYLRIPGLWVNVHAEGDPIGGAITGGDVIDVRITRADDSASGESHVTRNHRWPYLHEPTIDLIERVIEKHVASRQAVLAHYADGGQQVNRSLGRRIWGVLADPFVAVADMVSWGTSSLVSMFS